MGLLDTFLSEQTIERIGWVLVHFLWQGCALMALMWCVMKTLGKASSNARYTAACLGLALMVLAPVVTFTMLDGNNTATVTNTVPLQPAVSRTQTPAETQHIAIEYAEPAQSEKSLMEIVTAKLETTLPWCVIGWIAGVAALSLWYLGGWCQLQKLRRIGTKTVSDVVTEKAAVISRQLGIKKAVHIAESALVQVPTVIGWLKPLVLLPASALTGLDEMQLKAMIAHELAHIKRSDYLTNIVQTVVEILGFYHPAVWWMSRQIRIERENCCDDIAVALLQDRKEYAKALFSMEEIRSKQWQLAVAADGGHLTTRIERLAGKHPTPKQKTGWIPSVVTIGLLAALLVTTSMAMSNNPDSEQIDPTNVKADAIKKLSWEDKFYDVYRLDDGEVLKRIAPPFIPERKNFYYDHDPDQAAAIPEPPDYFTFHWDGQLHRWGCGFVGGARKLDGVLRSSLSIPADRFEGPDELLKLLVPGDWIVKKNISDAEKLKALEIILQEELDKKIGFQKRKVHRLVIVARGNYQFTPPSGTYSDEWVHFYSDKLDPDEGSGGGTADTVAKLIAVLGRRTGMQVIDETKNSSKEINQPYGHHGSSRLRNVKDQVEKSAKLDLMLKNLHEQTNLTFTVEQRLVSKWFVVDHTDGNSTGRKSDVISLLDNPDLPYADEIRYPKNWDEMMKKREGLSTSQSRGKAKPGRQLLEKQIDFSNLTKDTTIEEAIEYIRNATDPPLPIIVLWSDLSDTAFVAPDEPIGVDGLGLMTLETGLRAIVRAISVIEPIDFVVEDGVITIAAKISLPTQMQTIVYDVSEFITPLGFSKDEQQSPAEKLESLKQDIIKIIEPESWLENDGTGRIDLYANSKLIIYQTPEIQQDIADYLELKRQETQKDSILVEARFITLPENFMQDLNPKMELPEGTSIVDDLQTEFLIKATEAFETAKILVAPKMLVLDGETGTFKTTRNQTITKDNDEEEEVEVGLKMTVTPHLQDSKIILTEFEFDYTYFIDEVEMSIATTTVATKASIPDGGTILMGPYEIHEENQPPQNLYCLLKVQKIEKQEAPAHMGGLRYGGGARGSSGYGGRARGGFGGSRARGGSGGGFSRMRGTDPPKSESKEGIGY